MKMKRVFLTLLALLPAPAFAGFECSITQQCGGGTCEPFDGGPFLIEEAGDVWRISWQGQAWEGYSTTAVVDGGEVSIVIPPQNGVSGLISIYPTGEISFTAHAYGDNAVAITGSGTCMTEGG
jgi:hypothetical protein